MVNSPTIPRPPTDGSHTNISCLEMWGYIRVIHGTVGSYLNQIRLQIFPDLAQCDGGEGGLICFPLLLTKGKAKRGLGLSWQASWAPHGSATRGTWPGQRSVRGESPPPLS